MKKSFFVYLLVGFIVQTSYPQAKVPIAAEEQEPFFLSLNNALQDIHTLQADFTQRRYLALFMDPLESKGALFFQFPDRLRWEVLQPYHSILIYRENQIAKFDFQNNEIRKLKLGTADLMREILKQIIFWMQGDFANSKKIYDIAIFSGEDFKLILTPKSPELAKTIQSIELTGNLKAKQISKVVIKESQKDYIEIKFFNAKLNAAIDDKIFSLQTPLQIRP